MRIISLPILYLSWHYTVGLGDLFRLWKNFVWFFVHYFSIFGLLRTLFSPWKRLREDYGNITDVENIAASLVTNVLMRIVGAVVRIVTILAGLVVILASVASGVLIFVFWFFAPFIAAVLVINGLFILFT